jgi:DNA-binding CsgD family transcriptional regulator
VRPAVRPLRTLTAMDFLRITPLPCPPHGSTSPSSARLTARLNAEWTALIEDPAVAAELAREPIAGHHDLEALLTACSTLHGTDEETADALLAQVVAAGLEGRALAVRVTLQRVLGALVAISVRRTRRAPDRRVVLFDDLCATAWLVIAGYPLARRPRRIAVNICRDAEYLTCVRPGRLHDVVRRVDLLEEHDAVADLRGARERHPADELADLLVGLHGSQPLAEAEMDLLHGLAAGRSTTVIAAELGCTDRTVRNMRRRLVTKLRDLSAV